MAALNIHKLQLIRTAGSYIPSFPTFSIHIRISIEVSMYLHKRKTEIVYIYTEY